MLKQGCHGCFRRFFGDEKRTLAIQKQKKRAKSDTSIIVACVKNKLLPQKAKCTINNIDLLKRLGASEHNWCTHLYPLPCHAFFSLPIFFLHPICYPRTTTLALPPRGNSDRGSHGGPSSPLPTTTVRAFVFVARRIQHFLSSSTRVEQ